MNNNLLGILLVDLCKHIFIGAMPGHFKSSLIRFILISLFKRAIPVIVFEPGKSEYRTMKAMTCSDDPDVSSLAQETRIYTPGDDRVSPIRIDPLARPEGMPDTQKIDNAVETICMSGDYFDPLPQIIYEALSTDYYRYRHKNGSKPHIGRLFEKCEKILFTRYGQEVRDNLIGALSSRLSKLSDGYSAMGRIFSCGENIPSTQSLLTGCTIIELKALGDSDFPLAVLLKLGAIRDAVEHTPWLDKSKPRLVIILEESHRFFANLSNKDLADKVAEAISNMLKELRALGISLFLVNQDPLPRSILKATGTILVGRQIEGGDRQLIADCMMLSDIQRDSLAFLRPRDFFLFSESFSRAVKIRVPDIYQKISMPFADELAGERILPYIKNDKWFTDCREARITAELKLLGEKLYAFSVDAEKMYHDVIKTLSVAKKIKCEVLVRKAIHFDRQIEDSLCDFHKNYMVPLAGIDGNTDYAEHHEWFRVRCVDRFEKIEKRLIECQNKLKKYTKIQGAL
ncbi:MAG: hypothetical protein DRP56_00680 [Planctomycetota bacterium]|nr:MAG: hypothetical protein DRP56_00680 [Planctomycetota bacterium]